ncbi:MAG: DUF2934 domain-containing protein [Nitrospirae bacterium]|nr:DUF2934 domain-containing protein [Nitrospirota bacterium]
MSKKNPDKTQVSVEVHAEGKPFIDKSLNERIAQKAYEIYLNRGRIDGYHVEHWLEAEKIVLSEIGSKDFMRQWLKTVVG